MKQILKTTINTRSPIKELSKDWSRMATVFVYNSKQYFIAPMKSLSTGMNVSSSQNWKENQSKSIRYIRR